MKIVVLAGGLSTERDVSITSGKKVFDALKSLGHKVILLDVFMGIEEEFESIDSLFENAYDFTKSITGVSTEIPDSYKGAADKNGFSYQSGARGLICQCDGVELVSLIDFGSSKGQGDR